MDKEYVNIKLVVILFIFFGVLFGVSIGIKIESERHVSRSCQPTITSERIDPLLFLDVSLFVNETYRTVLRTDKDLFWKMTSADMKALVDEKFGIGVYQEYINEIVRRGREPNEERVERIRKLMRPLVNVSL